jgi:iron uptake system component EfeO
VAALAATGTIALWPAAAAPPAAPDPMISVSRSSCGQDWTDPRPGPQTIQVHNVGAVSVTVDLIDSATGAILGEVEGVGSATTRPLEVSLGDGEYALRCLPDEAEGVTSPTVRVSGTGLPSSPAVSR